MGDNDYAGPDYGDAFEGEPHTLNQRIRGSGISLGETEAGRNFVIKALDPSVDGIDVLGIPDITTDDVGTEKYRQFLQVQAPPLASTNTSGTDTFNFVIRLTGNPFAPFDVYITSAFLTNTATAWDNSFTYINSQIPPSTSSIPVPNYFGGSFADRQTATTAAFVDKQTTFKSMYQGVRGMWQSLSVKQQAATLSDQGFVVAAQQDAIPTVSQVTTSVAGAGTTMTVNTLYTYSNNDFPDINSIYALDRCFTGQSKDGVYMPTHLDSEFTSWKNLQDPVFINPPNMPELVGGTPHVPAMFATLKTRSTDAATNIKPLFRNVGTIFINGVAPGTTFQLMWRAGFEGLPFSSSIKSTTLHTSPQYDGQALVAISQIVRKHLMFAYPVSWNDGGGLLDWIANKVKDAGSWVRDNVLPIGIQALVGGMEGGPAGAAAAAAKYAGSKALSDFGRYAGLRPVSAVRQLRATRGANQLQRRIEFI